MKRILLLATTTGYQTRMFADAAARLGVELVYATDRCDQLDDPWRDRAIPVRFHEEWRSVDTILKAVERKPVHAVIALGDRPTVMAAYLTRLLGLPGNAPEAAITARDKRLTRDRLRVAGLPTPQYRTVPVSIESEKLLHQITFPVVIKPTVLSGSRGVIRADDALSFTTAFDRVRRLLMSHDVRELRDPDADVVQVETFIPGREYAIEAVMDHGRLRVLAIFDKPDPLDGPFFEESIYVTPSRAADADQARIATAVADGAKAIGLHHGPIHAECRVNTDGVYLLEIAARPIGGLCAKSLRFERQDLETSGPLDPIGFEEFLLRQALGEDMTGWAREALASAVMMIPIPKSGVYRRVEGIEAASAVDGVTDVQITAKPDQQLLALPEGASYLGFIFARAATAEAAERAVRDAHAQLRFTIDPLLPIAS